MKANDRFWFYATAVLGILLILIWGCKKNIEVDPFGSYPVYYSPVVTTLEIIGITDTTAVGGGKIELTGSSAITGQGICWSNDSTIPNITYPHIADTSGARTFRIKMTGLKPGTRYIVVAYATNSIGTGYGTGQSFVTKSEIVNW